MQSNQSEQLPLTQDQTPTQEPQQPSDEEHLTVDIFLSEATNEEVLTLFGRLLERVTVTNRFVQDEEGLITHQYLTAQSGDKILSSAMMELDWPLQPLPIPQAFQDFLGDVN